MNRRGFMQAILAAGIAPAVVKAANLMPVRQLGSVLAPSWLEDDVMTSGYAQEVGASLYSRQFTASGTFTVPEGVSTVWVTMIGAGGGGGHRLPMDSPFSNVAGELFNMPKAVTPGEIIPVTVSNMGNKEAIFTWVK